jgi:hypothetical protein
MNLANFRANFAASVQEYVMGKVWYWYLPLWIFGTYAFVKLIGFDMLASLPVVLLVPYSFDFMLHESAHLITVFLPPVLTASAGSISELLLGAGLVIGAFWLRNYFAALFCCLWFDLTAQSAGTYMADAIPQRLPLVSLGGALSGQDPVHDWNFVFGRLHMLGASAFIGNSLRLVGHMTGLFGLLFAGWIIYKIAASQPMSSASAKPLPPRPAVPVRPIVVAVQGRPTYPEPTRGPLVTHTTPPPANSRAIPTQDQKPQQ